MSFLRGVYWNGNYLSHATWNIIKYRKFYLFNRWKSEWVSLGTFLGTFLRHFSKSIHSAKLFPFVRKDLTVLIRDFNLDLCVMNLYSQGILFMCTRGSVVLDFVSQWTVVRQAPLFMGFSRQEYWLGLPCPPLGKSSRPRDWTYILCVSAAFRQILYPLGNLGSIVYI